MRLICLALAATPTLAAADICVRNDSGAAHLFAAEIRGGAREVAPLEPGRTLCATGDGDGVVSVYEGPDALEGCSRLVMAGQTESLLTYVDFDRCAWTSNQ